MHRYLTILVILLLGAVIATQLSGCPRKYPDLVVDTTALSVPENGTATFEVRLKSRPTDDVMVTVLRSGGDADITIQSGATIVFDRFNWGFYKPVTLAAKHDADLQNGTATFLCSAPGVAGVAVVATEVDDDANVLEGEGEGEAVAEGEGEGEGESSQHQTIMLPGNVPLEMVWIPAGMYLMGSPEGEQNRSGDEVQHAVTLSQGFWMGQYEFTQAQWKAVSGGTNPSAFQGGAYVDADLRPVEHVSWNEVTQTFLPALNTATSRTFRLPTEAEWEYACRTSTGTRFYWGDDLMNTDIATYAWYGINGAVQSHAVGTAGGSGNPNAFGLYDMNGNVWEWCQDWYDTYPVGPVIDPVGPDTPPLTGAYRVLRGGSWNRHPQDCRSAKRFQGVPDFQSNEYGFRVVLMP